MLAPGCDCVDCALEAVEDVVGPGDDDLRRLVVVVAWHLYVATTYDRGATLSRPVPAVWRAMVATAL
jgi:hypothetical protein